MRENRGPSAAEAALDSTGSSTNAPRWTEGGSAAYLRSSGDGLLDPDLLPRGGSASLFTLLYTSGSSGRAKGVKVTAESFSSFPMSTASPLVTASFIPLSHSSDRFRLWEFVVNGGRVGMCHYDHNNWLAHEKQKKSSLVRADSGSSNGVEYLLE